MSNFWYIGDDSLWTGKLPLDILGRIITLLDGVPVILGDVVTECITDGVHSVFQPYLIVKSSTGTKVIDITQSVYFETDEEINLLDDERILIEDRWIMKIGKSDEKIKFARYPYCNCEKDHYVMKLWGMERPFESNTLYTDLFSTKVLLRDISGNKLMRRVCDETIFSKINVINDRAFQLKINPKEEPKIIGRYIAFREWYPKHRYVLIPNDSVEPYIRCDSMCTFGKGMLYSDDNKIFYNETNESYLVAECPGEIVCAWGNKIILYYPKDKRLVTRNLILATGNKSY